MEVQQVLHMNGGNGDTSYASNSKLQELFITKAKAVVIGSISDMCTTNLPRSLRIADLGCSSGPNTLVVIREIIEAIHETCHQLNRTTPEFQVFLNDLPSNDFNTIFQTLPAFYEQLKNDKGQEKFGPCYIAGIPGSFYQRLFPSTSIDFFHSSSSVHWLSQVPPMVDSNKGNIYLARTSPPSMFKAYLKQFRKDFSSFLRLRAKEITPGGRMVLSMLGRRSEDPFGKESYHWDLLSKSLNDLVSEGLIEEVKVDSFNLPFYIPSRKEVEAIVCEEGSFYLTQLEIFDVNWDASDDNDDDDNKRLMYHRFISGQKVAKCVRAGVEPIIAYHFGNAVVDVLFTRYMKHISDHLSKEEDAVRTFYALWGSLEGYLWIDLLFKLGEGKLLQIYIGGNGPNFAREALFHCLKMEMQQVLSMNAGEGENSYANNSILQKLGILNVKPVVTDRIIDFYCTTLPECLRIANLGCSSGPNTLAVISEIIDAIDVTCHRLNRPSPEFLVFLNDLPTNDFNTVCKSLPAFYEQLNKEKGAEFGPCFIMGVPGSFFGRLFPSKSLHFVHSSYSLHWLSQVPEGLECNKGNIYIAKTSPPSVAKAYFKQFQKDFLRFLHSRAEEVTLGGHMVITLIGRRNKDRSSEECSSPMELLAMSLRDLVSQGLIEEIKVDSFNMPLYHPSVEEIEDIIKTEGSFNLDEAKIFDMAWDVYDDDDDDNDDDDDDDDDKGLLLGKPKLRGQKFVKLIRAVAEPLLASHFGVGDAVMDELFQRCSHHINEYLSKEKAKAANIVISMRRI